MVETVFKEHLWNSLEGEAKSTAKSMDGSSNDIISGRGRRLGLIKEKRFEMLFWTNRELKGTQTTKTIKIGVDLARDQCRYTTIMSVSCFPNKDQPLIGPTTLTGLDLHEQLLVVVFWWEMVRAYSGVVLMKGSSDTHISVSLWQRGIKEVCLYLSFRRWAYRLVMITVVGHIPQGVGCNDD
ncbi:hypothetical protein Ancab_023256 [Ancistrocladus abbreviatus]